MQLGSNSIAVAIKIQTSNSTFSYPSCLTLTCSAAALQISFSNTKIKPRLYYNQQINAPINGCNYAPINQ